MDFDDMLDDERHHGHHRGHVQNGRHRQCPNSCGLMATVKRFNVLIETCEGCGYIGFDDQEELEAFMANVAEVPNYRPDPRVAERYYTERDGHYEPPVQPYRPDGPYAYGHDDDGYRRQDHRDSNNYPGEVHGGRPKRKSKGFLQGLFEDLVAGE